MLLNMIQIRSRITSFIYFSKFVNLLLKHKICWKCAENATYRSNPCCLNSLEFSTANQFWRVKAIEILLGIRWTFTEYFRFFWITLSFFLAFSLPSLIIQAIPKFLRATHFVRASSSPCMSFSLSYLHATVRYVRLVTRTLYAIWQHVGLHILISFSSALCSDTFDNG